MKVGGKRDRMRSLVDELVAQGRLIVLESRRQTTNGRSRKTWLYGTSSDDVPTSPVGTSSLLKGPEGAEW